MPPLTSIFWWRIHSKYHGAFDDDDSDNDDRDKNLAIALAFIMPIYNQVKHDIGLHYAPILCDRSLYSRMDPFPPWLPNDPLSCSYNAATKIAIMHASMGHSMAYCIGCFNAFIITKSTPEDTFILSKVVHRGHDDVMAWKHFSHYLLFVTGIHRSPVDSLH